MTPTPFVLVDGSYFLFRAYHALPPMTTSQGLHTNAIRGAINAIQKLIKRIQPTYMAVIFDTPEPTFRHQLSPEYKGNRPSMPDDLAEQIPYLHQLIQALGIPLFKLAGAEADDIIGTLTHRAVKDGMHVLISTGDKDMAQLVCDQVHLEDSFKEKLFDTHAIIEKFGVHPTQIVDYLTLMGDAVDGIKGVEGIGGKTAAKLLNEYQTLTNIIANAHQIKGKVGQNIANSLEQIKLDHQLATIICDLDLDFSWQDLKLETPHFQALKDLYTELEFKNDLKSLLHPNNPNNPHFQDATVQSDSITYHETSNEIIKVKFAQLGQMNCHIILNHEQLDTLTQKIEQSELLILYAQTNTLDDINSDLLGIALAIDIDNMYYIPIADEHIPTQFTLENIFHQLKPCLQNHNIKKIGHNLKHNQHLFKKYGIDLNGLYFDTMLASYVLNSVATTRHSIEDICHLYLGHIIEPINVNTSKNPKQKKKDKIDISHITRYTCEQAFVIYHLYQKLHQNLQQYPKLLDLLFHIEMPISTILQQMEQTGISLDIDFLTQLSLNFNQFIQNLEEQAYQLAGEDFNLSSPKQVGYILFDKLALKGGKKTATGQYSTNESILEKLDHPIVDLILQYRTLTKLKSTYTDGLNKRLNPHTQRIHTHYNQALTSTGRLSSSDPNLQNIPIREEIGRQIRKAFIASPHRVLLAADYSQIELRLMAHFSQDPALIDAFLQEQDIHQRTASEVLAIPLDQVTPEQRRQAKAVNFGLLYGMSEFGLTRQLGFTHEQSKHYIQQYFARYPAIYQYMKNIRQAAQEQGFVETILGRRLYTPNIHAKNMIVRQAAERAAINAPLQGSAADIIKLAMIAIDKTLPKNYAQLLLQVHDELVFEVDQNKVHDIKQLIKQVMENVFPLSVPLIVEIGQGSNWEQAH